MKNWNYIFEEDEKRDSSDIDLEDLIIAAKEKPEIIKKFIVYIKDNDKLSDDEKKAAIKELTDKTKQLDESVNSVSIILEKEIMGSFLTDFLNTQPGLIDTIHSVKNEKTLDRYREMIKKETDPDKKAKLEKDMDTFKKAVFVVDRKGGRTLGASDLAIRRNINLLKKEGELPEDFSYSDIRSIRKNVKAEYKEFKAAQRSKKDDEPKDEETVKDKDGVEWIKRKKERGDGFTYCRKDDRSVTMSQKEYAKHNAQKNESLGMSLKDFITEKLN